MKKKSLELNTSKQKLLGLILTIPLSQIYSQSNKKVISNLKTQRSMPKKASIKRKLTWGCFVKNSLFDSLFLVNLKFSQRTFCVFWKGTMYGFL